MDKFSYIGNADVPVIDELYKSYKADPDSVDPSWKKFLKVLNSPWSIMEEMEK